MTPRFLPGFLLAALAMVSAAAAGAASESEEASSSPSSSLIERYRQTLEIDPDNQLLHYQLGIALLMAGLDREAVTEFRLVYPGMSDSVEMNYNLGLAYAHLNDADSALLYFEQAEALGALQHPELYPLTNAYFNLGIGAVEAGNLAEAARLFSRVLTLEPQRTDIHRILGDLFARSGEIDRALAEFSRYLQTYPDDKIAREYVFALHSNRGLQLLEEKRPVEAETAFSEALALAPDSSLILYYLGYIDYLGGQVDMAVEHLLAAFPGADPEILPSINALLYNCSLALLDQRKLRQALNAIAPLVQAPGATPKELVQAGNIHFALREFAMAFGFYQRALAIDPVHRGALQNRLAAETGAANELLARGESLLQVEDFNGAVSVFEQALAINSSDPRLSAAMRQAQAQREKRAEEHFSAARTALDGDRPLLALSLVRQGLVLLGTSAEGKILEEQILNALALELARTIENAGKLLDRGDLPAAQEAFARVLELDPANSQAQDGLQSIARQIRQSVEAAVQQGNQALDAGNLDIAQASYNEALRLQPGCREGTDGLRRIEKLIETAVGKEVQAGRLAVAAGKLAEARDRFQAALRLREDQVVRDELADVDQALAQQWTGLLEAAYSARAAGDFKRARTLYEQVLARQPTQQMARRELAALEKEVAAAATNKLAGAARDLADKNFSAAIAGFRRVLELEPANREAQDGLSEARKRLQGELAKLVAGGQSALAKGELAQAERHLQAALALDPYQSEAQAALRRVKDLRRTDNPPEDGEQLYLQGIELYTRGKYEEAVAVWEQILVKSPGHEKARRNIDKARRKVRQIKEFRGG